LEGKDMQAVTVNVPNLITEYVLALTTQHFLTVIDRKIEVLHAVRACFAVAGRAGHTCVLGTGSRRATVVK
jgi:hypothetical protein